MKKLICLVGILMLLMASSAWAAGTIIVQSDKVIQGLVGKEAREVVYLVTFGTDASSPASTALDSILLSTGIKTAPVGGWWLFKVSTLYGSTAPKDNTDMYIYRATGTNKIDILGGNGANAIDNAANNIFYPATSTQPLFGDDILAVSGNDVNNATVQIVLELYR
jgi:hypothetical protein